MLNPDVVKRLQANRDWQAVVVHIEECIQSLDIRVSEVTTENRHAEQIATDVLATQRALQILRELMAPFVAPSVKSRNPVEHTQGRTGLY